MVGRFACEELAKEALAHEDLYTRPGILGRCSCLLGAFLMVMGLLTFLNLDSLVLGALLRAPPAPAPRTFMGGEEGAGAREASQLTDLGFGGAGAGAYLGASSLLSDEQEIEKMTLDFSLVALCITGLSLCVLPQCARALSGPWGSPWMGAAAPWAPFGRPGQPQGADALLGPAAGAAAAGGGLFGGGALRGRVIDVKPGELRGAQAGAFSGGFGGFGGWMQGGGPVDWTGGAPATGVASWGSGGSWASPVPSAYAAATPGLPGVPAAAGMWPSLGAGGLSSGQAHVGGMLPTEADVQDTYAAFGMELQQWTPALLAFVDREVVGSLVQMLDESDQVWLQALTPRGWRLTFEAPRLAYPGVGPSAQELSVFDRHLPRPICDDPRAVELWKKRQVIEAYLMHPSFEPAQRSYVLDRLREWRQRGLQNCMRADYRPNDQLPTDAHILENILFKMLNFHMDFCSCFVTVGPSPPTAKHLGQQSTAFLRQVTDQNIFPKPAPHYEVVTLHKVWRIRPGNANLLEALALLLQALRRHSHSYQSFPQSLRTAVESAAATSAPARTFSWF